MASLESVDSLTSALGATEATANNNELEIAALKAVVETLRQGVGGIGGVIKARMDERMAPALQQQGNASLEAIRALTRREQDITPRHA